MLFISFKKLTIFSFVQEEVQSKFSQRFQDLEIEVKKRDDIIEVLQEHIRELEVHFISHKLRCQYVYVCIFVLLNFKFN